MFPGRGVRWEVVALGCAVVACAGSPSGGTGAVDRGADAAVGGASTSSGGAAGAGAGGTAGAIGTGGTGGTAGRTGGAVPTTEYGACVAYFVAECNRFSVCDGFPSADHPCPDAEASCPDVLFSPGSIRTVDSVFACAEVWNTFSCDEVHLGHFPACATNGTRTPGETCVYDSQCDSGLCLSGGSSSSGHPNCGTCTTAAAAGAACSYSTGPLCADGYECDQGKEVCVRLPPLGLAPGSACKRFGQCGERAYCQYLDPTDPSLGGTCQVPPALGEACVPGFLCAAGGYCSDATRKCAPLPKAGSPCGLGAGMTIATACATDAFCDGAASGTTCVARLGPGASCEGQPGSKTLQGHCAEGLSCVCSDATCVGAKCLVNLREGEACGGPNRQCVPGTACQNGLCVGVGQGTFAAACRQ